MDYKELYADLTSKLEKEIPIKAFPIRELVQIFREKGTPITLKSHVTIISVFNSGDISGILCTLEIDNKEGYACSLTHLLFETNFKLNKEVSDYQKKRYKRIEKLNRMK